MRSHRANRRWLRIAAGYGVFVGIWCIASAFGIAPSLVGALVVIVAIGASEIAEALVEKRWPS